MPEHVDKSTQLQAHLSYWQWMVLDCGRNIWSTHPVRLVRTSETDAYELMKPLGEEAKRLPRQIQVRLPTIQFAQREQWPGWMRIFTDNVLQYYYDNGQQSWELELIAGVTTSWKQWKSMCTQIIYRKIQWMLVLQEMKLAECLVVSSHVPTLNHG